MNRPNSITSSLVPPPTPPLASGHPAQGPTQGLDGNGSRHHEQHMQAVLSHPQLAFANPRVVSVSTLTLTLHLATTSLLLTVLLPPDFPAQPPTLSVTPPSIVHPLVDPSTGALRWEQLSGRDPWSPSSGLANYLIQVIQALQSRPPLSPASSSASAAAALRRHSTSNSHSNPRTNQQLPQPPLQATAADPLSRPLSMMALSTSNPTPSSQSPSLDSLDVLTQQQLTHLLNNHDAQWVHVLSIPSIQQHAHRRAQLLQANATKASAVVAARDQLKQVLDKITDARAELAKVQQDWEAVCTRHDALTKQATAAAGGGAGAGQTPPKWDPARLVGRVVIDGGVVAAEREADEVMRAKLAGPPMPSDEVEALVRAYRAARKKHHVRAAKVELVHGAATYT